MASMGADSSQKRRRNLFRVMFALYALWIGVLLAMYFMTVRHRPSSGPSPVSPGSSALPATSPLGQ